MAQMERSADSVLDGQNKSLQDLFLVNDNAIINGLLFGKKVMANSGFNAIVLFAFTISLYVAVLAHFCSILPHTQLVALSSYLLPRASSG